jgi:hypothetical protein
MSSGPGAIVPPYFHTLETLARSTYLSIPGPREILTGPARLFFLQAAVRQVRDVAGFGPCHGTVARMLPAITLLEERGITADTMIRELPSIAHHERQRLKNVVLYYSGRAGKRLSPSGDHAMTHADQHQMIVELMDYSRKMKRSDQEDFDMYVKRDKDDEDLDQISAKRLRALYELYVPVHRRNL